MNALQKLADAHGQVLTLSAESLVFRQGDADRNLYLLRWGVLKAFYTTEDGKEMIKSLLLPGDMIGSLTSAYSKAACSFTLECLTDCELTRLPFDLVQDKSRLDLNLATAVNDFLLQFAMRKERREFELLCLTAEDRYRNLLEKQPSLFEHINQYDIARYLGITPVALSRIKKRVSD